MLKITNHSHNHITSITNENNLICYITYLYLVKIKSLISLFWHPIEIIEAEFLVCVNNAVWLCIKCI